MIFPIWNDNRTQNIADSDSIFFLRLPQDIAQERMHTDIVDLLLHYKVVRNQNFQAGHITGHTGGHAMMRDSYIGMKSQGNNSLSVKFFFCTVKCVEKSNRYLLML